LTAIIFVAMSDDEFGFSSGDEDELVAAANVTTGGKRKLEGNSDDTTLETKRSRSENTVPTPSQSTALANRILKDCFRLNGFRLEQEGAITRLLDNGSAVVVFPTGGGKSLCYQVSGLWTGANVKSNCFRSPP
jgi:hypothetical protein